MGFDLFQVSFNNPLFLMVYSFSFCNLFFVKVIEGRNVKDLTNKTIIYKIRSHDDLQYIIRQHHTFTSTIYIKH
jgi:hypothetical protein